MKFMDDVEAAYGQIFTYSIHEDGTESPNWFSEETLLTVSGSKHRIERDGKSTSWFSLFPELGVINSPISRLASSDTQLYSSLYFSEIYFCAPANHLLDIEWRFRSKHRNTAV